MTSRDGWRRRAKLSMDPDKPGTATAAPTQALHPAQESRATVATTSDMGSPPAANPAGKAPSAAPPDAPPDAIPIPRFASASRTALEVEAHHRRNLEDRRQNDQKVEVDQRQRPSKENLQDAQKVVADLLGELQVDVHQQNRQKLQNSSQETTHAALTYSREDRQKVLHSQESQQRTLQKVPMLEGIPAHSLQKEDRRVPVVSRPDPLPPQLGGFRQPSDGSRASKNGSVRVPTLGALNNELEREPTLNGISGLARRGPPDGEPRWEANAMGNTGVSLQDAELRRQRW